MNERIKELAKDAGINLTPAQFSGVLEDEVDEFTLEKFAQLIVQECQRQVEEQYKPVLEDTEMMKDTHWDGYVQCGVDSYVAIREHFFGEEL